MSSLTAWLPSFGSSSSSAEPAAPSIKLLLPKEASNPSVNPYNPSGHKVCCACPITKKARDDCFLTHGSNVDSTGPDGGSAQCREIVEQHLACMRGYGFKV